MKFCVTQLILKERIILLNCIYLNHKVYQVDTNINTYVTEKPLKLAVTVI